MDHHIVLHVDCLRGVADIADLHLTHVGRNIKGKLTFNVGCDTLSATEGHDRGADQRLVVGPVHHCAVIGARLGRKAPCARHQRHQD